MTNYTNEFIGISEKMLESMIQAVSMEEEKRRALLDHDMLAIESVLQEQQAMTMRLENMEKKRISAQKAAGFAGMKMAEIINAVKETNAQETLTKLFQNMQAIADQLKELNKASIEIAKVELRFMNGNISESDDGLYTAGGRKGDNRGIGSSFSGKI